MKKFSSFCIALSAAALLTGGLTGQAQSQEEHQSQYIGVKRIPFPDWEIPRDKSVDNNKQWIANYAEGAGSRAELYLSRGDDDRTNVQLSVTIRPRAPYGFWYRNRSKNQHEWQDPPVLFSDIEVRPDGSYEQELTDGSRVTGKLNLVNGIVNAWHYDPKYVRDDWIKAVLGEHYINPNRRLDPDSRVNRYGDRHYMSFAHGPGTGPLSSLMFFESQHYSEDNYRKNLDLYKSLIRLGRVVNWRSASSHAERGTSLSERNAEDLSVDLRLHLDRNLVGKVNKNSVNPLPEDVRKDILVDTDYAPGGKIPRRAKQVVCEGKDCRAKIGEMSIPVLHSKDFIPYNRRSMSIDRTFSWVEFLRKNVRVVLPNQGIYLTLDKSFGGRPFASPFSFGAWMDDAGFFVVPRGFVNRGAAELHSVGRMVVAVGERTGDSPAADAVWRGSMVGTASKGEHKDNLLRGEAELTFDMDDSMLDANFFNIRDYDRFGEKYVSARGVKRDRMLFPDIPVAADGSYAKRYRKRVDNRGGSIRGAFYGEGHYETAGTFRAYGVLGAFGAKKVEAAD